MEFQKFRTMHFPRDVYIGHDVLEHIVDVVGENSRNKNAIIVSGDLTYELAGRKVHDLLSTYGYEVHVFLAGNANYDTLERIEYESLDIQAGIVIGVGGGAKIDLAKKLAFDRKLPFVSVPTAPSHDGIASPRASLRRNGISYSEEGAMPIGVIADTAIMIKAPYRYLAAGAADVISNLSAVKDWKLAHRLKGEEFSSSAAAMSEYSAQEVLSQINEIKKYEESSVWLVTKNILASGTAMAIAGNSRPGSGSEHLFAHALEAAGVENMLHGEMCAMGTVISMYLHDENWQQIKEAFDNLGISIRSRDYGIEDEIVINALRTAHAIRPERYTILGESDMSYDAAVKALELTGII
ncbi:glycerol 1-phosphate dehydrogenase related protein [Thermoplasma acidophilum]|uniref:Glycerol-1-phosphate dehydrogenase [NAD(P)+] n=1 Tax=Thermoplasma acidophilum (strain ATCC 25905 / DSM 1728 / JCM 9062 / NBRC 15155 / AMRC-C165) TaxID=273075 RepID=G1PDH_THEAC|nr:NAD(P)-dependent glycerol-1-phosphate dehydrogenase [Thermoplasma acidophilum]Q9HJ16.1 RecName: Full=Glycerol-1-phosphate dehydrogenase [NAD(P)+]; Short=G1P dehydrogenase; Short=G1PDH; AltName: Full=Enantiomeric glycerophosphate synthase; AltName: Full=sn-glycerol-1-phosphate dehydrogenase [Thermoplasma acidophilum DSM 1728]MCY0851889.1 NAD(P)-dependent glycerol-1-phosphate dehydrogenase [Thermoplasma acidophilum]CAC12283.1 glycerol 1-phosphate dehydrogenase related protein [Thermoplasma acid